jgi:hypothetical protein
MSEPSRLWASVESRVAKARDAAVAQLRGNPVCTTADCIATKAKVDSMGFFGRMMGPAAYNVYYNSAGNTFGILFYISLTIFVIFLMLLFVNFTMFPVFSFSPNDAGFIPIPTASDQQLAFVKGPAAYNDPAVFTKLPACTYTLGADVYLSGNFMLAQMPRVILYRAAQPFTTQATLSGITDATKESDRLSIMNTFLNTNYPHTNIIVWLDPIKNDLYVSIFTINPSGGSLSPRLIQTTHPVENVPIKKVFRLAVVFTTNFVEIYVNGRLEQSMAIRNPLTTISDTSSIYSSVSSIAQNVMIGNLSMWPRVLTAREINASESVPKKDTNFFFKVQT